MPVRATVPTFASAKLQALERSSAVAVFGINGRLLQANANFLRLFGYKARDIIDHTHTIFIPPEWLVSDTHQALLASLQRGEPLDVEHPRLRKDGTLIWVHGSYTPIRDSEGRVAQVVMLATDITAAKLQAADDRGQIIAINTSQAVVHFELDGTVSEANPLFLRTMDYGLDEVVGAHHRMFVDPKEAQSEAYQAFWQALAAGQHQAGVYRRIGRGGRDVWLQATYNPIFDMNGKPFKIVKYATDVSAERLQRLDHEGQIAAINESHGVITFDMQGTVLDANANFLDAMGYRLDEIEGRHHRMFVDPSYAHGPEYASFWNHLCEGRHQAGEYRRVGKNGREVWLQSSYNPIADLNGKLVKVVKYTSVITREKLRQADHQGQIASIHKAQCVVSFELDGTIIDANDNFLDATGYRLAEVRGRHHRMFVDEATASSASYHAFWNDLSKGQYKTAEFKRVGKNGLELWLQASYNPIFDMNGRPFKVVKYATDVTQERLRQADNAGQIAAIRKSQCVVVFDMDGQILEVNDNFLAATGYRRDEVEGRHHRIFVEPEAAQSDEYQTFWDTLRSGMFLSARFRRIGKGGRPIWIQATYNPIFDLNGRACKVIKIASDVSADVALATDLVSAKQQAEHDAATGLPNRVGLTRFMNEVLARPDGRLAILYLDLDHFKPINDTFGHHIGDHVLRETANRLRQATTADQTVARIGGDEFVLAAPNLSDDQIDALCHRLIQVVQSPIRYDDHMLAVGLSIGAAVSPGDATTADDLLRCADVALYRTKGSGRGSYSFFAKDMHERLSADRNMAEEMRHGIKAGQFFLEYRPRFEARHHELQGVDVQVRWAHPERGRIDAADFIALAERSGLVVPLGEWVLRTAFKAAEGWPDIIVSVKVSPVQFFGIDLASVIEAALAEFGLAPERLELEMMEGILIDDADRTRAGLNALKALGVRLTLNDHDSQQSLLGTLRDFPFDLAKIDRRFIADIEAEEGGGRIVQEILSVDHAMSAVSIVRGVETTGHLLMLARGDRNEVRGFLLSPAVPAREVGLLLQEPQLAQAASVAPPSRHRKSKALSAVAQATS